MSGAIEVSDSLSNTEEQIEVAAKAVGRGARRKVFEAIYYHKAKVKTAGEIARRTHLSRIRVLQEARHLVSKQLARQTKKDDETAYEKISFFHVHKRRILQLAWDPAKLATLPTKRRAAFTIPRSVRIPTIGAKIKRVSIDDISSFSKVRRCNASERRLASVSEDRFKRGLQRIVGEPGKFRDWGGEKSDLFTTRLRVDGKRLAAAFALKGPAYKGKLVPGRMGANGDQIQRLFREPAEVFLVQHWREIDPSVLDLMRNLAVAKSVTAGGRVWYGVIDGRDSERLYRAYRDKFSIPAPATKT
jgi:hypothetical protein